MSLLEAIVLGLVQGITEFLPISSTAHLRIAPALLGWEDPGAAFSAVIQLGTVAAVVLYFRRDLVRLGEALAGSLSRRSPLESPESRRAWFVVVGTVPVSVVGLLFKDAVESQLRSLHVIATSLVVLGIVLYVVERRASHRRTLQEMTLRDGVVIGVWQALALIPGSSRSGTTLTGGLSLGFKREDAARYSFLLSIPANALAGLFQLREILLATHRPPALALALGTLVAFGSGLLAIAALLRFLRTRTTLLFVGYRLVMGALLFGLLGAGLLHPHTGLTHGGPMVQGRASPPAR